MTSASSSCKFTRTTATRSTSPLTEYTSLTPSSSAIAWAASGIRATSVSTRTMAVITAGSLRVGPGSLERPGARRLEAVPRAEGAVQRCRPLPLEVDEPDARLLQPAQYLLGLLRVRGGHRRGGRGHVLARGAQRGDRGPRVGARRGHGGPGEAAGPPQGGLPAPPI